MPLFVAHPAHDGLRKYPAPYLLYATGKSRSLGQENDSQITLCCRDLMRVKPGLLSREDHVGSYGWNRRYSQFSRARRTMVSN